MVQDYIHPSLRLATESIFLDYLAHSTSCVLEKEKKEIVHAVMCHLVLTITGQCIIGK
jgi:hypothetical protein